MEPGVGNRTPKLSASFFPRDGAAQCGRL